MMLSKSLSKLTSDILGQSGHVLPQALCTGLRQKETSTRIHNIGLDHYAGLFRAIPDASLLVRVFRIYCIARF
jgi:hypothetical protein